MKFSNLPRTSLQQANYNPGPGYYLGSESKYPDFLKQAFQQANQQTETFSHEKRFKSYTVHPNLGPGSYNIISDFTQKKLENKDFKLNKNSDVPIFKVNAIPSIPSNNITAGYQEIGEGLLILMRGNKQLENENLGPGTYDANYFINKPKTKGFVIKEPLVKYKKIDQASSSQATEAQASRQYPQVELIPQKDDIGSDKRESPQQSNRSKQRAKKQYPPRLMKAKLASNRKEQNKIEEKEQNLVNEVKEQEAEYNLELLVLREKMLAKADEMPAPGQYYNEKAMSSIKIKGKPEQYQCFDSKQQRFKEDAFNEQFECLQQLGPGCYASEYSFNKICPSANKAFSFAKSAKKPEFISSTTNSQKAEVPPVGIYFKEESFVKNSNETAKVEYPAVFGSGTVRFQAGHDKEYTPGPGEYQINVNYYKKKPRFKKIKVYQNTEYKFREEQYNNSNNLKIKSNKNQAIMNRVTLKKPSKSVHIQNNSLSNIFNEQDETADTTQINNKSKNENILKLANKNNQISAVFKSKQARLALFQNKSHSINIGPGQYELTKNNLVKRSFNNSNNLMSREIRPSINSAGIKKIGPGSYNQNIDAIKIKQKAKISFI